MVKDQYVRTNEGIAELHIQFILGACLLQVSRLHETCFFKCLHTTGSLPLPCTMWRLARGASGATATFLGRWSMMQAKTGDGMADRGQSGCTGAMVRGVEEAADGAAHGGVGEEMELG